MVKTKDIIKKEEEPWKIYISKNFNNSCDILGKNKTVYNRINEFINKINETKSLDQAIKELKLVWHHDRFNLCKFNIDQRNNLENLPLDLTARVIELSHDYPLAIMYSTSQKIILFICVWKSTHTYDSRYHPSLSNWTREFK